MDEIEKLTSLIKKIPSKRVGGKLNKLLPVIDQRIREGVSHEEIVKTLNENDFSINLHTFRSSLYRYRNSLHLNKKKSNPSVPNSNLETDVLCDSSNNTSNQEFTFEDMLDAKKRDALGEKYVHRKRPIFKPKE